MEELSAQNSRAAHDRRHFNNVLMKLLEQEKTGEAAALLQSRGMTVKKKPLSKILMLCMVLTPLPTAAALGSLRVRTPSDHGRRTRQIGAWAPA